MRKRTETKRKASKQPIPEATQAYETPKSAAPGTTFQGSAGSPEAIAEVDKWLRDDPPYEELDDDDEELTLSTPRRD